MGRTPTRKAATGDEALKPVLLTFAGRIASGKSVLSRQVAASLGWSWASFGDHVRAEAMRLGMDPALRTVLQQVSDQLLSNGWYSFCRAVLAEVHWAVGNNLVLDGIRHKEVLVTLADLVSPQPVLLVFVNTPDELREERLHRRGVSSREQRIGEQHESELQARTTLMDVADLVVDGSLPLEEATQVVLDWLTGQYPARG
jgi:dephospho-CoA kinase